MQSLITNFLDGADLNRKFIVKIDSAILQVPSIHTTEIKSNFQEYFEQQRRRYNAESLKNENSAKVAKGHGLITEPKINATVVTLNPSVFI